MDKRIYFVSGYIRFNNKYESFEKLVKVKPLKKSEDILSFRLSNYELKDSVRGKRA